MLCAVHSHILHLTGMADWVIRFANTFTNLVAIFVSNFFPVKMEPNGIKFKDKIIKVYF